jgi:ABC-type multidrug transport system fused ATPase/permease subunit
MAEQPIGDIVKAITADVKELVRDEVQLAKAELVPAAKTGGIGAGLLAGAAFFGVSAVFILYFCVVYVLVRLGLPEWASFLIVGAALLVLAGLLGAIGFSMIKKVKAPQRAIAQAKETVDAVKASAQQTLATIKGSDVKKAINR